jgi:hypothetical protein
MNSISFKIPKTPVKVFRPRGSDRPPLQFQSSQSYIDPRAAVITTKAEAVGLAEGIAGGETMPERSPSMHRFLRGVSHDVL